MLLRCPRFPGLFLLFDGKAKGADLFAKLKVLAMSKGRQMGTVKAKLALIDWGFEKGIDYIAAKTPRSRKAVSEPYEIELVPYGCAKLRMTELPFVKKD